MDSLRAVLRLAAFFITAGLTVFLVLGLKLFPVSDDTFFRWKNFVVRWFAQTSSYIIGLKMVVKGTPPKPPFFITVNHLGYIDILPLWHTLQGTFIAKNEVKSWPFFGFACKTLGVLFIDRNNSRDILRVNQQISSCYNSRQGVILFPEGTSSCGADVLPFNAPLLFYPAREEIPVSYATLSYQTDDPSKPSFRHVCWWGKMTFFDHFFNLLKIKKITATITFGDHTIISSDRKQLAETLHLEVRRNFLPLVSEKPELVK